MASIVKSWMRAFCQSCEKRRVFALRSGWVLECTEDLETWREIRPLEGPLVEIEVEGPAETGGRKRFYRVRQLP